MNTSEFNRWWSDFAGRFPSVALWMDGLGEQASINLLRSWSEAMRDVELEDALEVNRLMSVGDLEPIGGYHQDRERTAITIRRAAKHLRSSRIRRKSEESKREIEPHLPSARRRAMIPPGGIWQAVQTYLRLVKSGRTSAEALEASGIRICDDESGPRYRCPTCRDSGLVLVWHYESMVLWRDDHGALDDPANRLTMMVPCRCDAGLARVWDRRDGDPPEKWTGWVGRSNVFSERRFFAIGSRGVLDQDEVERFASWCAAYWEHRAELEAAQLAGEGDPASW